MELVSRPHSPTVIRDFYRWPPLCPGCFKGHQEEDKVQLQPSEAGPVRDQMTFSCALDWVQTLRTFAGFSYIYSYPPPPGVTAGACLLRQRIGDGPGLRSGTMREGLFPNAVSWPCLNSFIQSMYIYYVLDVSIGPFPASLKTILFVLLCIVCSIKYILQLGLHCLCQ